MTPQEVKEQFSYTPTTGIVIHRVKKGRIFAGQPAGRPHNRGYLQVNTWKHGAFLNHRLAWCLHYGEWPDGNIDHIDRDKWNNRIDNLRIASRSLNRRNSADNKSTKSGVRGVLARENGRFLAYIDFHGNRTTLGTFDTIEEAAAARSAAEKTIWKEH